MKPETIIALKKRVEALAKNVDVKPGEYSVDDTVVLRLHGTIKRGQDFEITPTRDVPLKAVMALALEKIGFFKRNDFKTILVEAMTEAINMDKKPTTEIADRLKHLDWAMEQVEIVLGQLPKKTDKGKCTANCVMEEISAGLVGTTYATQGAA